MESFLKHILARGLFPMAFVMPETIVSFLEGMFVGPIWPASIMACLLLAYTLLTLLGIFHLDMGVDADLNADVDLGTPDVSGPEIHGDLLGGIGGMTVRWMNLDRLPMILWLSVFTVAFWVVSFFLWYGFDVQNIRPP